MNVNYLLMRGDFKREAFDKYKMGDWVCLFYMNIKNSAIA